MQLFFCADTDQRCKGVAPIFRSDQSPNLQGYFYFSILAYLFLNIFVSVTRVPQYTTPLVL